MKLIYMVKKNITPKVSGKHIETMPAKNSKNIPGLNAEFSYKKNGKVKIIMVTDDDPAIVDVLTLMLEAEGFKVYASANGQTIADVNRIRPDLILLDILMSGINGHDICKQLKTLESTKTIPVIMISASKDAEQSALKSGADDFISKPFEMQNLLRKVTKYANM